jgi:glutamine synthetase
MRKENSILVLCETYLPDKETPARFNFRHLCNKIMKEAEADKPWFGMEQEFFLLKRTGTGIEWPLGWPLGGFPAAQGRYYCAIGDGNAFGRPVIEAMIRCAVSCGLKISGINGEVAPGQWEY